MHEGSVVGQPRLWLRLEGVALLLAGVGIWLALGGFWLWLVPLLLVPDIVMLGYLRGPALGASAYNVVHNLAVAIGVLAAGTLLAIPVLALAGAVLVAHVGMDRAFGYGLKYPTSFQDTHLGRIGRERPGA